MQCTCYYRNSKTSQPPSCQYLVLHLTHRLIAPTRWRLSQKWLTVSAIWCVSCHTDHCICKCVNLIWETFIYLFLACEYPISDSRPLVSIGAQRRKEKKRSENFIHETTTSYYIILIVELLYISWIDFPTRCLKF